MGFEELWDGFDKITEKTAQGEEFTKSIIKYLEKRHEVETKYSKGLAHLVPLFAGDREDGTTQAAWFCFRDETETLGKDRVNFCAELQKLIDDLKAQLLSDKKNRAELLAKGRKLVKDLAATEEIHKQARLKYVDARKKQQKSDENFKKIKAQGGNTTKPEKTLKKDKDKANTADHEYRKKVIQLANAQDKFHLDDMPSLLKEFEAFERARLTATRKHFIHFTTLQASLGPLTTASTERFKKKAEAVDTKADLDLYVSKNKPANDQPPPRAQYMSWDGTVVEDVGPPRAKTAKVGNSGGSSATLKKETQAPSVTIATHDSSPSTPHVATETTPTPTLAVTPPQPFKERTLVAMYAYEATEDGELTFDEGAHISVLAENDSGWWRGRLANGQEGLFPSNFMAPEPVETKPAHATAAVETHHDLKSSHHDEPKHDHHETKHEPKHEPKHDHHETKHEEPKHDHHEPKHDDHKHDHHETKHHDDHHETKHEPVTTAAQVVQEAHQEAAPQGGHTVEVNAHYIALYDYDAEDDTELTIHEGDVLFVISETDGWYYGNNEKGQRGNFPSNFVDPYKKK